MKKTKFFAAIVALAFMQFTAIAQTNFRPGMITWPDGDTLSGLIDYQNWQKTPLKISFRENLSGTTITYRPEEIKSFTVADEYFTSARVLIDKRTDIIANLTTDPTIYSEYNTVFLATVVLGNKSLYNYNDGFDHLYIPVKDGFELLIFKKYIMSDGQKDVIVIKNGYMSQLSAYLDGCTTVGGKIGATTYNMKSMRKLFGEYYDCANKKKGYFIEKEKIKGEIGILAGVSNTHLKFQTGANTDLSETAYKSSQNFAAGIFFDLILPRTLSKFSINSELIYTSYSAEGYFEDAKSASVYTKRSSTIGFSYIKLNNMARYRYLLNNGSVFANIGISNGIAISEQNSKTTVSRFYTQETIKHDLVIKDPRKYEQGYLLGLGGKLGRYSFEARMEKGNGMSPFSGLKSTTTRFYGLFGYRLR